MSIEDHEYRLTQFRICAVFAHNKTVLRNFAIPLLLFHIGFISVPCISLSMDSSILHILFFIFYSTYFILQHVPYPDL